jgi:hypothetical protein
MRISYVKSMKTDERNMTLTAGSAKNDMPIRAQNEAMSFPIHVVGAMSPYPTVHRVICNDQSKFESIIRLILLASHPVHMLKVLSTFRIFWTSQLTVHQWSLLLSYAIKNDQSS